MSTSPFTVTPESIALGTFFDTRQYLLELTIADKSSVQPLIDLGIGLEDLVRWLIAHGWRRGDTAAKALEIMQNSPRPN